MLRRTPLRRGNKPLRRTTRLRARGNTAYRRRERDVPRMLWTKRHPCIVRELPPWMFAPLAGGAADRALAALTPCRGRVEADHMGARGIGQKAGDETCVPMCSRHHGERHAHAGTFFPLTRDDLRAWRTEAIARTQAAWEGR